MDLIRFDDLGEETANRLRNLYEEAFPSKEKKPFESMRKLEQAGRMEILSLMEKNELIGLNINMLAGDLAILDYYAILPEKRSGGYGSKGIQKIMDRFRGKKLILEIEKQDASAPNAEQRANRKRFYLRNGLKETNLFVNAYDTDFELLVPEGDITYQEYISVLSSVLGREEFQKMQVKPILQKNRRP